MALPEVVSWEEWLKARLALVALVERSWMLGHWRHRDRSDRAGRAAARRDHTLRGHSRTLAHGAATTLAFVGTGSFVIDASAATTICRALVAKGAAP
jgi:hypothetical protein